MAYSSYPLYDPHFSVQDNPKQLCHKLWPITTSSPLGKNQLKISPFIA